jgi:hypothetical protein
MPRAGRPGVILNAIVILSGVAASRSEAAAQSKDFYSSQLAYLRSCRKIVQAATFDTLIGSFDS